jgi:stage IV sporulation protein FB
MRFERGFLIVGHVGRAPVRIHWSWPLGAAVLTRFKWEPLMWLVFVGLVIVHERGHAFLVRRYRMRVTSIEIHAFGGECRYTGEPTERQTAVIAWGGVLAQALLLPVGFALSQFGPPSLHAVAYGLSWMNLWMIGFNLMPIPPLDGSEAWKLPRMWLKKRRQKKNTAIARDEHTQRVEAQRETHASRTAQRELERLSDLDDVGVELPANIKQQLRDAVARVHEDEDDPESG